MLLISYYTKKYTMGQPRPLFDDNRVISEAFPLGERLALNLTSRKSKMKHICYLSVQNITIKKT